MRRNRWGALGAWLAAYATLLLGLLWSRHVEAPYLIGGCITWFITCALVLRPGTTRTARALMLSAVGLLAVGLVAQAFTTWRLNRLAHHWPQVVAAREANMRALLDQHVGMVATRALRTASSAAQLATTNDTAALFRRLEALRQRSKVDAIAVFGEADELLAWSGEHRAQLPEPVRFGISGVVFIEQPLYSYIYFPAQVRGRRAHAVVAILLDVALHENTYPPYEATVANVVADIGAVFRPGHGPPDSWPLVVRGDTVAHARLAPLAQSEWRARAVELAQRLEMMIAAIVLLLLGLAWVRSQNRRLLSTIPLLAATGAFAFAPLGALGLEQLFSPALFLLPVPGDISLGTLLGMLISLAALAASVRGSTRQPRWPMLLLAIGAGLVAIGYPGAIRLLVGPGAAASDEQRAAGMQLLLGGAKLWFGLQLAAVLLLGIITELCLPRWNWSSTIQVTSRVRPPWVLTLVAALATSVALSVVVILLGQTRQSVSPWLAGVWALPFLLASLALAAYRGRGIRLIRWLTAGWLAASAVLPFMWIAHVDARLHSAEHELRTLGSDPEPYLDYLLMQFSREARTRARGGEVGIRLLYRSWVGSGLAREAYPARLTLWSRNGVPEEQLPLGNFDDNAKPLERPVGVPSYLEAAFTRVRANPDSVELMRVQAVPEVNQVLIVALDSSQILTVEVPPRRSLERSDLPFVGLNTNEDTHVQLVPARPEPLSGHLWVPTQNGWRSETQVRYADGDYHAHMDVLLPGLGVRVARGTLLLAFDLILFAALWLVGRAARGEHLNLLSGWRSWRGSFRARVTATLFFFFLIPTAVFGWVAYSALAGEVTRATRVVGDRAVQEAVVDFQESGGDLQTLSRRTGSQVLYYFQGELARASSPEARELGVYGAWMPPDVYLALTPRGDEDAAVTTRKLAGRDVLTSYRALQPAGTLAVPMSLESGQTVARQGELAHLILFAALIGGLLSLLLSVVVGRALTGPIGRLQRAAAQVGSGNLRVRMPEDTGDEFGELFASFNRMVRRLRRARTQEVRSARVLAWGEMARQVAHEIKNPLTPIKLAVQHLKRAYSDGKSNFSEVLDRNVEQVLLEIDRLSEIARAFSRYGAPALSTGPLEPVDVEQVIHEALTLYRAGDPDVEYREVIDPYVPRALGRPGELKEVLINLLENARTALDGAGGTISVSARETHDGIELIVRDNGPGIPSDFLPRIFEPHFSTRTTGTGLGLAIVRRIVESWGGTVTAESETGQGTTIRITLREAEAL